MADKHRRVRSAVVTGVGQLLGLLGSTLIGVLVAGTLAPSPRVDAFFAANQIYALSLYLGQAVRITAPALIVRSGLEPPGLNRATLWLASGTIATMVLVALGGGLLVAEPARDAFRSDLLILAPAAGIHVAAGGLAARMSVVGSFGYSAAGYAAGSVVSGLLLLLTIGDRGASALAPCIAAGGLTVGVIMVASFRGAVTSAEQIPDPDGAVVGPGPARDSLAQRPTAVFALRRIGLGSVPALSVQLLITVVTLAAGHVVTGGTALLSYSFLALFAFTTIAITPMAIVLGPEVAERWHGDTPGLVMMIRQATRLSMVFAVPLVALAFLIGRPLAEQVLSVLTDDDLDNVFSMLAALSPSLLLTAAATAATVGITAADRLGRLASYLCAIAAAAIVTGVLLAQADPSLFMVAGVGAVFSLAYSVATLYVAIGRETLPTMLALVRDSAAIIVPPIVATALLAPLAEHDLLLGTGLAVLVLGLHGAVVLTVRRETVLLLLGAARRQVA